MRKFFGELEIGCFTEFCEESYDDVNYLVSLKCSALHKDSHSNLIPVAPYPTFKKDWYLARWFSSQIGEM